MHPVSAPDSLASCVLSLLELGADDGPGPSALATWQEWLAERNLQLLRTAELPDSGFWIAEHEEGGHAVMFGSPPGPVHEPTGPGTPRAAWVLTPLDPVLRPPVARRTEGTVEAIVVAPVLDAPCALVQDAEAVAGRGLRGDRYFKGVGTFSRPGRLGQDLTLIEAEALDEIGLIGPAEARRNVVTRGVDLNALIGERFRIGEVECLGRRWCEPCAHLQRLTQPGVLRAYVHRGGLRADIVAGGTIRVGDPVVVG